MNAIIMAAGTSSRFVPLSVSLYQADRRLQAGSTLRFPDQNNFDWRLGFSCIIIQTFASGYGFEGGRLCTVTNAVMPGARCGCGCSVASTCLMPLSSTAPTAEIVAGCCSEGNATVETVRVAPSQYLGTSFSSTSKLTFR